MRRTRAWRTMAGMKAPKDPTGQPAEAAPETRSQRADRWAQAMVDGLNRNVRAEHEDPGAPDEDAAHSQRWQEIGAEIAAKRSEENTSELQSRMRTPYAVFSLKKKNNIQQKQTCNRVDVTTTHCIVTPRHHVHINKY